jgi:UDP-glucose 4-epimerase
LTGFSRVLVVGGAGFIGSHIVDRLISEDVEVTVLDNLFTGRLENLSQHEGRSKLRLVRGDVRNLGLVKRVVKDADAVYNEAAIVSVPRSIENPILTNQVNAGGTLNLLKACLDSGVRRFIQASSASVYGKTRELPVHEDLAPNPASPYAVAELTAENYARVFHLTYGLQTVCLRYFNVYGPRQAFSAYSGAIMVFLNQLMRDQRPVIFGNGNQTRDFVYVEDIVEANMLALKETNATGEVFNIASAKPHTINELVRNLQERLGKQHLKPLHKPPRKGDIRHSYASIRKAERILGYKPTYSLARGIDRLVEWYQTQNQNPKKPR